MGTIRVETRGSIATVVMDSAGKRNAISADMWSQFEPLLADLAADPSITLVVFRGAGENFSAGADIGDLDRILPESPGGANTDGGILTEAENAIAAFPKPTVAAIDGYCVGGGWEIAGACDLRISSDRSTFGITPSRLGILYPQSGIERLVSIAGPAVAKHLLFTGVLIGAEEALKFGLVTEVIPADQFWDAVAELTEVLSRRSQYSIRAMKEIVDAIAARRNDVDEITARWLAEPSTDRAEGVEAFLSKQAPEFQWKVRKAE